MNELALFAGAGGGILGGKLLGWRTVCAVEWEPYPASVLIARQNDGILAPFPIWDDVRTFDGRPWRGRVDVVSGGFPCQDISSAGKGAGIDGARSGMWAHMARIIREVQPQFAFVENSPMLTSRGLGRVLGDLAAMGYDARWGVFGAVDAGAPHKRDRIWIVAHAAKLLGNGGNHQTGICVEGESLPQFGDRGWSQNVADALRNGSQGQREDGDAAGSVGLCSRKGSDQIEHLRDTAGEGLSLGINGSVGRPQSLPESERSDWWATEPDVGRVAHGVAARVDRLKAIGNGQVPAVAALAWKILTK
jgi:DNA (cytosine-5)-methyltransferase 1